MNYLTFFRRLRLFLILLLLKILGLFKKKKTPKISLLIPFSSTDPVRKKTFKWLLKYWKHELPEAEIIIGESKSEVFCKAEAFNNAVRKSRGQVLIIIDADAYLSGDAIRKCADMIIEEKDNKLWFVPYRHLYRLTKDITEQILGSNPKNPLRLSSPPPLEYIEDNGINSKYGHLYGAMIMMLPREAYDAIGGFDERFKGWGGEDVATLRALDTLYGKHKTIENDVLHLWHPVLGNSPKNKMWTGQTAPNANGQLVTKYYKATGNPGQMKKLINEARSYSSNYHSQK